MTEVEKLDAGLEYDFWDKGVNARKLRAIHMCAELNAMPMDDESARETLIRELFGSAGSDPSVGTGFNCDYGLNIHVGKNFLTNYNVTILDIAPVHIGDYVMIGPNPVAIGDDVWIGGNVTILPGVTIGNNVVIAAGAVVTRDVPDNSLVGGVPAKVIREIENDVK